MTKRSSNKTRAMRLQLASDAMADAFGPIGLLALIDALDDAAAEDLRRSRLAPAAPSSRETAH
jgi:hypothetical protein